MAMTVFVTMEAATRYRKRPIMGWNLNFRQHGRAAAGEGNQSFCDYLQMKRNRLERTPGERSGLLAAFLRKTHARPHPM